MSDFDLSQLLRDVFDPVSADRVTVLTDTPHGPYAESPDWEQRRAMAADWLRGFEALDIPVNGLVRFPATGAHNADLPPEGDLDGETVALDAVIERTTLLIAMTEYSATAPLSGLVRRHENLRAASMPRVLRRMEQSALAADHQVVAYKAHILRDLLQGAETARVRFSDGSEMQFDLRFRTAHADDGMCRRDKPGVKLINLPSGEAFSVPYEGEHEGEPSRTEGTIPVARGGEVVHLHVRQNLIEQLSGEGPEAERLRAYFDADLARRNVAELGLGCNDRAIITGNVLEDEKAGFHWAYGRSEHLGGWVGPDAFQAPENVVHQDIVYARGCPIEIDEARLDDTVLIRDGAYVIF